MNYDFCAEICGSAKGFYNLLSQQNSLKYKIIQEKYNLTNIEIFIVGDYVGVTGDSFDFIYNDYLRIENTYGKTKESLQKAIYELCSIIKKFPTNKQIIYRICDCDEEIKKTIETYIEKRKRIDKGFMSCTKSKKYINQSIEKSRLRHKNRTHSYILTITNNKLLEKSYDISELSIPYPDNNSTNTEEEVIFLPGFEGEIKDIKREGNVTYITL